MTIHFICRGNTYRSRLAETYLNSKHLLQLKAISSGIEADINISGPVGWYTQRIIQKQKLVPFEKMVWDKTTKELLGKGDFTIFMQNDIYNFCVGNLGFNSTKYEVWDIADTGDSNPAWRSANEDEKFRITEKTFEEIKRKVEELIVRLSQPTEKSE
jgi:protein-tyrosine-phosphatase